MANLKYCEKCLGNGYKTNLFRIPTRPDSQGLPLKYYTICDGFIDLDNAKITQEYCPQCNTKLKELHITQEEWRIIQKTSTDVNLIFALDKLKQEDIIEFNVKMAQFKQTAESIEQTKEITWQSQQQSQSQQSNTPKCPTCNSTNIKKISGTRRWLGVGLFGIASSDVGKTRECNDCGYKW